MSSSGAQADGPSSHPAVCDDGSIIVYATQATNLTPGDVNEISDVVAYDVGTGATTRVGSGSEPAISGDCGTIVYVDYENVYSYDVATGETTIVSVDDNGNPIDFTAFPELTENPDVSYDGGVIVYSSDAATLVPGDTNGARDVFAYDVAAKATTRVSVLNGGGQLVLGSYAPVVSGDGETVAYYPAGLEKIHVHNLVTGVTTSPPSTEIQTFGGCVAGACGVSPLALSHDGDIVVYEGYVVNVGGNDVYRYDFSTGVMTHMSASGASATGRNFASQPTLSSDGTTVVFLSQSLADDSRNGLFASTIGTDSVSRIGPFAEHALSGDGTMVVYSSGESNLVTGDTNGVADIFLTRLVNDAGTFDDDEGSVFESDIEWLADSGITSGCGPRLFCPDDPVTRGQMAAFLHRALPNLDAGPIEDFGDDDSSVFEGDIEWLAATGITRGCNPPANDQFCPDDPVTRGQMAAFLVRALGLTDDGGGNGFVDDNGSVFEADIARLAASGITRGCNPPANDRFCPDDPVTRGAMAAFLRRALTD